MPFYSQWYRQSVRGSSVSGDRAGEGADKVNADVVQVDLTPVQVTVSSFKDRLVYNVEYKSSESTTNLERTNSGRRTPNIHSREDSVASTELNTSSPHVGAAANAVVAKFLHQNHSKHSSVSSSISGTIVIGTNRISSDSLWEDWIDINAAVEDASMEEWIFETM